MPPNETEPIEPNQEGISPRCLKCVVFSGYEDRIDVLRKKLDELLKPNTKKISTEKMLLPDSLVNPGNYRDLLCIRGLLASYERRVAANCRKKVAGRACDSEEFRDRTAGEEL